jgi:hypothetical protein
VIFVILSLHFVNKILVLFKFHTVIILLTLCAKHTHLFILEVNLIFQLVSDLGTICLDSILECYFVLTSIL